MSLFVRPGSGPSRARCGLGAGSVDLLLIGGVPGAGTSTAIAAATPDLVGVTVLDPDSLRRCFAEHLPAGTSKRCASRSPT